MTDVGGIQLLPETRKGLGVKTPGENIFLYTCIAIIVAVFVSIIGLNFYKNSIYAQIDALNQGFIDVENSRDKTSEASLEVLNSQLSSLSNLVKDHVLLTKAFAKIEDTINQRVVITNLSIKIDTQKVSIQATAPDYTTVARQLASFLGDDTIQDVIVGKMTRTTANQLGFVMDISFNWSKLFKSQ